MNLNDMVTSARDVMTVRRVFGDPIERDGVTLVPAAIVRGGLGGGGGHVRDDGASDRADQAEGAAPESAAGVVQAGEGGGFGVYASPAGAYSVRDGQVRWHPAINVNLIISAATAVTITWLITRSRGRRAAGTPGKS